MSRGIGRERRSCARPANQRRPVVESLETRAMLAGNVQIAVDSVGNLRITGDNADNRVTITQSGSGSFLIAGQNTTINGAGSRTVTGVRRSVSIDLRGGNDALTFNGALPGARFTSSFSVRGGLGSDTIDVDNVDAASQVLIDGGGGADALIVTSVAGDDIVLRTTLGGDSIVADGLVADDLVQIDSGEGDDTLTVVNSHADRMTINTGFGDDEVTIDELAVDRALSVNTSGAASGIGGNGRGDTGTGVSGRSGQPDGFNRGIPTSGGGDVSSPIAPPDADELEITNSTVGSAVLATGGDADDVVLDAFEVVGNLVVVTGDGDDFLDLLNVIALKLSIELGAGNDQAFVTNTAVTENISFNAGAGDDDLSLANVAADDLFAAMGTGDDDVAVSAIVSLATRARIDGGSGTDSLTGNASITAPLKQLIGLESVL